MTWTGSISAGDNDVSSPSPTHRATYAARWMSCPSVAGVEEWGQVLGAGLDGLQMPVAQATVVGAGPSAASVYLLARGC